MVKIVSKWEDSKYYYGMDKQGTMYLKSKSTGKTFSNAGQKIKKGVVYNRFINPDTEEQVLVKRHTMRE